MKMAMANAQPLTGSSECGTHYTSTQKTRCSGIYFGTDLKFIVNSHRVDMFKYFLLYCCVYLPMVNSYKHE